MAYGIQSQRYYSRDLVSQKYPIEISSQRFRQKTTNDSVDLPKGWIIENSDSGKVCYRHASEPKQQFWYPVPFPESFTTETAEFELCPLFLHVRTRRCSLTLGATFENPETSQCLSCDIIDREGKWAGVLRLNLAPSSVSHENGSECSLVQLSFGSVHTRRASL